MYTIEFFRSADVDLFNAYNWYEERSSGLGERFAREVDKCLALIINPHLFSERYRFALLKHFPFRIVYRIDEKHVSVYLSAIFHTSRDPKRV